VEEVVLDYEEGNLLVNFRSGNQNVAQKTYPVVEKIAQLRKGKGDEQQALTAVHESGHAVAHLALFHQAPELVLSVAAEAGSSGLAVLPSMEILNLEKMKRRTAVLLAGLEAERLIFGEDLISAGSYGDIETATSMVIRLLKESGFGGSSIRYASAFSENAETYHDIPEIENLAKSILEEAQKQAQEVVRQEEKLLLEMAAILAEHPSLSAEEVNALVKQYGSAKLKDSLLIKELGYKELLAEKVGKLQNKLVPTYGEN
jgi:cell division protease FtsH